MFYLKMFEEGKNLCWLKLLKVSLDTLENSIVFRFFNSHLPSIGTDMIRSFCSLCLLLALTLPYLAFVSYQSAIDKGENAFQQRHFEMAVQYWDAALHEPATDNRLQKCAIAFQW
jgi:hypothetical protein